MTSDPNLNFFHRSTTSNSEFKSKTNRRRRSLKTLFHIPCSARSSSGYDDTDVDIDATSMKANGTTSTALVLGSVLPQDIIRDIVDLLSPADILSLSLTVRVFFHLSSFFLRGGEEGFVLVSAFTSLPSLPHSYPSSPLHSLPTSAPSSSRPYTTPSSSNPANTAA